MLMKCPTSASVQRPYSGTAGRTEIPQRVYPQPDQRLRHLRHHPRTRPDGPRGDLPQSWPDDREHCRAAEIPDGRVFATKPELARATAGAPVHGATSGHGVEVAQEVECAGDLAGISAAELPSCVPGG